jgi:hypothetical protein
MLPCRDFFKILISLFTLLTSACSLILLFSNIFIATCRKARWVGIQHNKPHHPDQCVVLQKYLFTSWYVDREFHFAERAFSYCFPNHILTDDLPLGFIC